MQQTLQEYIDSRGVTMRVDREAGILRGVKILGVESRNGRSYLPQALSGARDLYEAAKVNVNHPKGSPTAPRDYQERIGVMRNVTYRAGEGLFGDLHYNPKHALAEQLIWDAEHAPENVGFSHNVLARTARQGERLVVEAINKVHSVDLVADPATTRGLFEAAAAALGAEDLADEADFLAELTLEDLHERRGDLVEQLTASLREQVAQLNEQLEALRVAEAVATRAAQVRNLLAEYHLPDPQRGDAYARTLVDESLIEALTAAPDEPAMRRLLETRARLVASSRGWSAAGNAGNKPACREQHLAESELSRAATPAEFARSIT